LVQCSVLAKGEGEVGGLLNSLMIKLMGE